MTDIGQGVDFSPLKLPDYVGGYQNAFQVGRAMAARASVNAFRLGGTVASARPVVGGQGLSPADRADIWTAMAQGLRGRPYAERSAILAHLSPVLSAQGFPAQTVRAFDPTDDNLDAFAASVRTAATASPARQTQGGQPAQKGDGNEAAEQPGGDGLNVGDAEVER